MYAGCQPDTNLQVLGRGLASRQVCGAFSQLVIDVGGFMSLWAVPALELLYKKAS